MSVDIRTFQPEDTTACLAIFDSNLPTFFTYPEREQFAAFLARMNIPYFVAEADGEICGCGGYALDDYGVSYLAWGMVHATWHRRLHRQPAAALAARSDQAGATPGAC